MRHEAWVNRVPATLHPCPMPHAPCRTKMITSMTGFGRSSGAMSPRYFVAVTAKSVNHRFLEVSLRLPEYLWEVEAALRALASETFSRGKLDVAIRVQRTQQPEYSVRINTQIANVVIPQLRAIADELG